MEQPRPRFDAEGRRVCQPLSDRCLTISFENFSSVADRVAVGGYARAEAVLACVRARAATTLVTEAKTSLTDTTYQQILTLVRDKPRPATQLRAEPFWGRQARPTLRLSGDTWVSSWQNVA